MTSFSPFSFFSWLNPIPSSPPSSPSSSLLQWFESNDSTDNLDENLSTELNVIIDNIIHHLFSLQQNNISTPSPSLHISETQFDQLLPFIMKCLLMVIQQNPHFDDTDNDDIPTSDVIIPFSLKIWSLIDVLTLPEFLLKNKIISKFLKENPSDSQPIDFFHHLLESIDPISPSVSPFTISLLDMKMSIFLNILDFNSLLCRERIEYFIQHVDFSMDELHLAMTCAMFHRSEIISYNAFNILIFIYQWEELLQINKMGEFPFYQQILDVITNTNNINNGDTSVADNLPQDLVRNIRSRRGDVDSQNGQMIINIINREGRIHFTAAKMIYDHQTVREQKVMREEEKKRDAEEEEKRKEQERAGDKEREREKKVIDEAETYEDKPPPTHPLSYLFSSISPSSSQSSSDSMMERILLPNLLLNSLQFVSQCLRVTESDIQCSLFYVNDINVLIDIILQKMEDQKYEQQEQQQQSNNYEHKSSNSSSSSSTSSPSSSPSLSLSILLYLGLTMDSIIKWKKHNEYPDYRKSDVIDTFDSLSSRLVQRLSEDNSHEEEIEAIVTLAKQIPTSFK